MGIMDMVGQISGAFGGMLGDEGVENIEGERVEWTTKEPPVFLDGKVHWKCVARSCGLEAVGIRLGENGAKKEAFEKMRTQLRARVKNHTEIHGNVAMGSGPTTQSYLEIGKISNRSHGGDIYNTVGTFSHSPISHIGPGEGKIVPGRKLKEGEDGKVSPDELPPYEHNISDKMLPVHFLLKGSEIQRYVGKIVMENSTATGFLVSDRILMTNWHVFQDDEEYATESKVIFGYNHRDDFSSVKSIPISSLLVSDQSLDYALLELGQSPATVDPSMNSFIQLPSSAQRYAKSKHYANIIGHPRGEPKMISFRSNKICEVSENIIEYTTDTESGSSGSPVFGNNWGIIALHSRAGSKDKDNNVTSNIGIRIDKIVTHIKLNHPTIYQELFKKNEPNRGRKDSINFSSTRLEQN